MAGPGSLAKLTAYDYEVYPYLIPADSGRRLLEPDEEETDVIFRVWTRKRLGEGVLALFPGIDAGRGLVQSFAHEGQHGGASYDLVMEVTRPATPEEYEDLRRELESPPYGYRLRPRQRRAH